MKRCLPGIRTPRHAVILLASLALGASLACGPACSAPNADAVFVYGTPSGCLVKLKKVLGDGEHIRWEGDCQKEYASGVGTLTILDGTGKALSASRGTMQGGIQSGQWSAATPQATSQTGDGTSKTARQDSSLCNSTLNHLSSRIPNFTDPDISRIRTMLLGTDIRQTISAAKQQGFGPNQAVDASLAQARENDKVARQGAECAADVDAWGTTDDAFYQSISAGRIDRNINCQSSIRNSCLCAAIVNRMSAIGSRAIAAEMQCFIKNNRW